MLTIGFFGVAVLAVFSPSAYGAVKRILLVGDSWAQHMWDDRSIQAVLGENGLSAFEEEGTYTAVSGATAHQFATNAQIVSGSTNGLLDWVTYELDLYPTIDIVHLSLGANDLLWNGYRAGLSDTELTTLVTAIRKDLQTVVDYILAQRPTIKVVLCDYDYFNFVDTLAADSDAEKYWEAWGKPTAEDMNNACVRLGKEKLAIALSTGRCYYVQNWGLCQYLYGYSPQYAAGQVPFPGYAPNYTPYPGGDSTLPTPPLALDTFADGAHDPLHLNPDGFKCLALNCVTQFYQAFLAPSSPGKATNPSPAFGSTSDASDLTALAWTAGDGATRHMVYFGTDATALPLVATQESTVFTLSSLKEGATYFWRIDEVAETQVIMTGDVWQFSVSAAPGCQGLASGVSPAGLPFTNPDCLLIGLACLALVFGKTLMKSNYVASVQSRVSGGKSRILAGIASWSSRIPMKNS